MDAICQIMLSKMPSLTPNTAARYIEVCLDFGYSIPYNRFSYIMFPYSVKR